MFMIRKIWDHFEEYILIGSFLIIIPLVFLQVVMRYVFQNSLTWSEELARYIFLWQIWLGASYATKKARHIRIEIIKEKLSQNGRAVLEIIVLLAWMFFALFLTVKGFELSKGIFETQQLSPAMLMPMGYAYLSVPVGSLLMVIRLVEKFWEIITGMKRGKGAEVN
ncbi:hypothetical protein SDC9_100752 [bioreactor metagenome]|uniref:Tripartite ATP-independent periplasmic transporters DctQ component domain-containing protein n=1 Tax=bioreactor metagenome TaxID=1076179 RepID=A0A645ALJ2_9ZZZZ